MPPSFTRGILTIALIAHSIIPRPRPRFALGVPHLPLQVPAGSFKFLRDWQADYFRLAKVNSTEPMNAKHNTPKS